MLAAIPDAATLRHSLAESIDDPGLALIFPREDDTIIGAVGQPVGAAGQPVGAAGQPVGAAGQPVGVSGTGLAVATVRRASRTVAEVRYRAERAGAEQLSGTAVRSAGLALEHVAAQARLRAELARPGPHGDGSSRMRTPNGGAWNVTCMTAPSSGSSSCMNTRPSRQVR